MAYSGSAGRRRASSPARGAGSALANFALPLPLPLPLPTPLVPWLVQSSLRLLAALCFAAAIALATLFYRREMARYLLSWVLFAADADCAFRFRLLSSAAACASRPWGPFVDSAVARWVVVQLLAASGSVVPFS